MRATASLVEAGIDDVQGDTAVELNYGRGEKSISRLFCGFNRPSKISNSSNCNLHA